MYDVIILGAGNIAAKFDTPDKNTVLTHAHAFTKNSNFRLLGFYDKDQEKAEEAVRIWGGHVYQNMETALKAADIVCCCVPDMFHKDILIKIASHTPKLVITEKPLASSLKEAEEVWNLYNKKIPLLVNYSRRFLPEFQQLKEKIKGYGSFLRGVGYYGKGLLHNGSHMIDLLNFLLLEPEEYKILPYENYDFEENDPSKEVIFQIGQGVFHMIAVDCRIATIFEMDLIFERARIRILDGGNEVEIYTIKGSEMYAGYKNYRLSEIQKVDYSGAMEGMVKNAEGFLMRGEKLLCDLEDAMRVLKLAIHIRGE